METNHVHRSFGPAGARDWWLFRIHVRPLGGAPLLAGPERRTERRTHVATERRRRYSPRER